MFDQPENNFFNTDTNTDKSKDLTQELQPHLPYFDFDFDFDTVQLIWIDKAPIKTLYEIYLSITLQMLEHFMISTIREVIPALYRRIRTSLFGFRCIYGGY